jgi:3-methyladenine DNA glycosylase AlkC
MAEKLKNMFFTRESVNTFAASLKQNFSEFDIEKFIQLVFDDNWELLELKARMHHTTTCLRQTLPMEFALAIDILMKAGPSISGFEGMTLHDYVELYGMGDFDESLAAIRYFNQFASGEFAIRPFLDANPKKSIKFLLSCADDESEKVRRFASEGCRPRLPWAMALPKFKNDPSPIIPILEKLKDDSSEFVRKSVANNLNDISKDNPEIVLELCEKWQGSSERTDWIIKHGCRTLLKAGNVRAMLLFGFGDPTHLEIKELMIEKPSLAIGEDQNFTFLLQVNENEPCNIRLEYAVGYVKSTGKISSKIFQISEKIYQPGEHRIARKQTFVNMSTRKHYAGTHSITIIVNGVEKATEHFTLHN